MIPDLSPIDARHIIETLGSSGLPADKGISHYNVGNASLLDLLEKEYFADYLKAGGASFKLVVGDYGAGKSHLLLCIRDLAWRHKFVVSRTELSARSCPYDDQLAVYGAIARNIIWHNDDLTASDDQGLEVFLANHFNEVCSRLEVDVPGDVEQLDPRIEDWLGGILRARVESKSFQHAVYHFFLALARGEDEGSETLMTLGAYLRGEQVGLSQVKRFNINEKMDKKNAFRMLRSLCQMIHELGYVGTVLLFDEGDRMVSIGSSRQEKIACDNLREVVDCCARNDLPGALFIYAVPPSFVTDTAPKYPALQQRVAKNRNVFSRKNPRSPIINLETLDLQGEELLKRIGERLLSIYEVAYQPGFDRERQIRNIEVQAEECANILSDSHRREFVITLINSLDEQREEGEVSLDKSRAQSRILRVKEELMGSAALTAGQAHREY